ncbi:uncharacterized protein F4812DRAFT_144812 [Daldinia caldariorum]|uniref:uncharacterized protein n=1 Tax=Daldinia caldariorum TaxID=326644 RepID=UPI002007A6CC|nr:uncharacterized protein F4812DRAFT_144812 [Daldinia caldariorum]KAI1464925.1 hypothetical protein F4812DRAFT_144812 [Daldinia caldariorum]
MDTIDVSEQEKYITLFQQFKENAEKARRRKGEKPRDHPLPMFLTMNFLFKLHYTANVISQGSHMLYTSQVPPFYPPCARPVQELKRLMISDMGLETHHRGSYVMIHVMTPPNRMTAVTAIVEDQEGTAVLLQLYNQPEESMVAKEHIIRENDVCIIKEPFFKVTSDGSYSLRVDHVSDITWLQDIDSRIPIEWAVRILSLNNNSESIRKEGNEAVKKKDWAKAERLYTNAIRAAKTAKEGELAHLNRSLANFYLDRPEKALIDAQKGNTGDDSLVEKALFREAKALYALRKFSLCREKLVLCVRYNPKNSDAWSEIKRVQQRLNEETTGSYRFGDMYEQANKTPPLIDCATYVGSVEVRDSPGRGKGLFTTKPVKAGELLLCEKAFAYSYAGDDSNTGRSNTTVLMNWNTNNIWLGGQANLINQTVQKLYHNPDEGKAFTELDHRDYTPVAVSEVDGAPVVDTFFVVRIIQLNSFGAPRTSYKFSMSTLPALDNGSKIPKDKSTDHTTCGIWPIASRINHSCVPNCCRAFIGDMQIVRACTDLEAGAELVFEYRVPGLLETYEETQKKLSHWGFVCKCARCLNTKSTPRKAAKERSALAAKLALVMRQSPSRARIIQATALLKELEKTYVNNPATPPVLRMELPDGYFALGAYMVQRNKPMEGLEMLLKGLEAFGYVVEACPPRDMAEGKTKTNAVLNIKRWGKANEFVVWAFSKILHAYNKLAPDLSDVAKGYFRVSYSISCGEDETIQTIFPGFE